MSCQTYRFLFKYWDYKNGMKNDILESFQRKCNILAREEYFFNRLAYVIFVSSICLWKYISSRPNRCTPIRQFFVWSPGLHGMVDKEVLFCLFSHLCIGTILKRFSSCLSTTIRVECVRNDVAGLSLLPYLFHTDIKINRLAVSR